LQDSKETRVRHPGSRIIVVGCGRVGSLAATMLSGRGDDVVVVDRDESTFRNLGPEFSGFRVAGDAAEPAVLRAAAADRAHTLFAATDQDTLNLFVVQLAREEFQVETVVARVFLPEWEGTYREMGIGTVSPVRLAVEAFLRAAGVGRGRQR
jgi:trk system potassium uptake protein TrkA